MLILQLYFAVYGVTIKINYKKLILFLIYASDIGNGIRHEVQASVGSNPTFSDFFI